MLLAMTNPIRAVASFAVAFAAVLAVAAPDDPAAKSPYPAIIGDGNAAAFAVTPDGKSILVPTQTGDVRIFDTTTARETGTFHAHDGVFGFIGFPGGDASRA